MNRPLVIAHRGASAYAPENTLSAIKKAVQMGADGIEIDVQLSKDGHVVVIHDTTVNRTSNGSGKVNSMTLEQLKTLDFGSWFSEEFKNEPICTLEEVFGYLKNWNGLINVEIKKEWLQFNSIEKKVVELIDRFNMRNRIIVSSFSTLSLLTIKRLDKNIRTGILFTSSTKDFVLLARLFKIDAIHPWYKDVTKDMKKAAVKGNIKIHTYTVDDVGEMKRLAKIGIDGIITNIPDVALKALNNK
ncbi:glycerophosphodiester phosphodiesterase [Acetivibrio clariflavus]|uniref:Glycerophosphoryl diester phosphodiesterase n=1 Tax=Acetivibrio clariflavus (strain DSM 19732 / NBRC 101661 / EBR45) TaxID=720554 RepID=G8LWM9_ACECE|nr:glycerophosphodiester phosphodiesterase [Acetivibrio clariflavus]AEV68697.1 glycerophosphoryl diester phosphodiesterase [Acetivibrio clariflavus DSM 19732]